MAFSAALASGYAWAQGLRVRAGRALSVVSAAGDDAPGRPGPGAALRRLFGRLFATTFLLSREEQYRSLVIVATQLLTEFYSGSPSQILIHQN